MVQTIYTPDPVLIPFTSCEAVQPFFLHKSLSRFQLKHVPQKERFVPVNDHTKPSVPHIPVSILSTVQPVELVSQELLNDSWPGQYFAMCMLAERTQCATHDCMVTCSHCQANRQDWHAWLVTISATDVLWPHGNVSCASKVSALSSMFFDCARLAILKFARLRNCFFTHIYAYTSRSGS